ncbi:hypothetical protein ACQEVG_21325 [Streptomyces sp. CA-135486]|uniref:hypothetical protein n=1 Tax=Streptomyces sp. CA-135486 TaxID=3240049 RepID=UPI003D90BE68
MGSAQLVSGAAGEEPSGGVGRLVSEDRDQALRAAGVPAVECIGDDVVRIFADAVEVGEEERP